MRCRLTVTTMKPPTTYVPTSTDAACQLATKSSPAATAAMTENRTQSKFLTGNASPCRSSKSGFTWRISSSGTSANKIETSTPIANPCTTADPVSAVDIAPNPVTAAACSASDSGTDASATRARPTPSTAPPSPSTVTCVTYTAITRAVVAPRHFITATLRSLCCTKTRVTLQTPMPPRTTTTNPIKLR